jgi:hypothetical protein
MAWTTASQEVREAARDPAIAAVLARSDATCAAIVAGDPAGFAAGQTRDACINSPANRVLTAAQAEQGFAAGLIDYHAITCVIDHAALLPEGLVVIMGEETVTPRGRARDAGKTVRRRFTDIWRNVDGVWAVAVRQATVIDVAEAGA